jgi:hypothetical protein
VGQGIEKRIIIIVVIMGLRVWRNDASSTTNLRRYSPKFVEKKLRERRIPPGFFIPPDAASLLPPPVEVPSASIRLQVPEKLRKNGARKMAGEWMPSL